LMRLFPVILSVVVLFILSFSLGHCSRSSVFSPEWEIEHNSREDANGIRIEAIKHGNYVVLFDKIWDIHSGTDFYVYFDFEPDPSTINFTIYSEWEREEYNQDGVLRGVETYWPSNRTLHFQPEHVLFFQRLQNIPEYYLYIGDELRTASGDTVLSEDLNITIKIEELNTDGDDMPDYRDPFPLDPTQWLDSDADGYGDNLLGNNPDQFPSDKTQWVDSDGDGHGDNASGNQGDLYRDEPAAWRDTDGDGEPDEVNASYDTDLIEDDDDDNDGYLDVWEIELQTDPRDDMSTPPDLDEDGIPDAKDADIDGDSYSNKREDDAGTDPYDPDDHPSNTLSILVVLAIILLCAIILVPICWFVYTKKMDPQVPVEEDIATQKRGGRVRGRLPPRENNRRRR